MVRVIELVGFLALSVLVHGAVSIRHRDGNCVKVPDMCYKLISNNYTHMRLPNMLNHTRKEDVAGDLHLWNPLLQSKICNAGNQLKYFLCFTYAPVCVDSKSMNKLIPPCKSMCQAVRHSCEPVMRNHNYSWPQVFDCDQKRRFLADESQMCISSQILAGIQKTKTKPMDKCSCKKEYKVKHLKTMVCKSHLVFRGKLQSKQTVKSRSTSTTSTIQIIPTRILRSTKDTKENLINKTLTMKLFNGDKQQNCRCHKLRVKKKSRGTGQYFVIGRKQRGELQVDAMGKWKDLPNSLKRAVKQC